MRVPSILVFIMLSTSFAVAEGLPEPTATGDGHSTQSVSAANGATTVIVDSSGGLDLGGGGGTPSASGQLSVGIDVLGATGTAAIASPTHDAAAQEPAPGFTERTPPSERSSLRGATCQTPSGRPLSAAEIGELAPAGMSLADACSGWPLTASERRAISRNKRLSTLLASGGYAVGEIVGLALSEDGSTLLVTPAYADRAE